MRSPRLASALVPALLAVPACGEAPPPPPAPALTETPVASAPPPPATTPAPPPAPAPSPEELKKQEAAKQLEADRAKLDADHKAELERWTPELRAATRALADKAYPSGKAAVQAAIAGKHRKPAQVERDKHRHPVETLDFFGFQPGMTVLDVGPGDGWWTAILAPAVAKKGKYIATNGDPSGPVTERSTYYAQRFKWFTDTSPEAYGKIQTITIDGKAPRLDLEGKVDLALVMRGLHGMHTSGTLQTWLTELHKALKPNGTLGIEEHRATPDANPDESAKRGYLAEKWVVETIEKAGFKLASRSDVNANPKDTKDYADGVWTLPPTLRLGDKDREKYVAIGESDRMTLKFVKVARKDAKAESGDKGAKPATPPAKN